MKNIVIIFMLPVVLSCESSKNETKQIKDIPSSQKEEVFELKTDFVDQFDAFKVTATDSSGKSRFFALESVKPYREDEAGSWYYRWWVKEDFYKSNEEAESIFKSTYDGLSSYDDMENKGYNARILLHKDRIYSVTGGCKEGRFIEEWFQILVDKMKITLETGNTIESNCGGQIKLK